MGKTIQLKTRVSQSDYDAFKEAIAIAEKTVSDAIRDALAQWTEAHGVDWPGGFTARGEHQRRIMWAPEPPAGGLGAVLAMIDVDKIYRYHSGRGIAPGEPNYWDHGDTYLDYLDQFRGRLKAKSRAFAALHATECNILAGTYGGFGGDIDPEFVTEMLTRIYTELWMFVQKLPPAEREGPNW